MSLHLSFRPVMLLTLVLMLSLAGAAYADGPAQDLLYKWGEGGRSLDQLPEGVASEDGKLTAYADYDDPLPAEQWMPPAIPLYLINRADKPVTLSLQDGHPHLYLEVQIEGKWKRAESFQYPSCGNSFHQITLKPDTFVVFRGYQPSDADGQAPARFRRQHNDGIELVTNVGLASYRRADVYAARIDPVAIRHEVPFGTLVGLLNGVVAPTTNGWGTQRWGIYGGLGRRYPDKSLQMVNQWSEERRAQEADLYTLTNSVLHSPHYDADDLIGLYNGHADNAFARERYQGTGEVLQALGQRFPTEAIAFFETLDNSNYAYQGGLSGLYYGSQITLDELMWCLRKEHELKIERRSAGAFMGRRFGEQALALRPWLIAEFGDAVKPDIKELEWTAITELSADRMIDVVEGRLVLMEQDLDDVRDMVVRALAQQYTTEAQQAAARWSVSDDPALVKAAELAEAQIKQK